MGTTMYEQVLEIAGQQRGYLTTRDATKAGVPTVEIRKLAQRGRLTREGHGLYRIAAFPRRENDEFMKAALWPAGRGVISHQSALMLWGLADVNPRKIDVTVGAPYRPRRRGGENYRLWLRQLSRDDIDYIDDIPVTTPERTLRDVAAARQSPRFVEQAVSNATARGLVDSNLAREIRQTLAR